MNAGCVCTDLDICNICISLTFIERVNLLFFVWLHFRGFFLLLLRLNKMFLVVNLLEFIGAKRKMLNKISEVLYTTDIFFVLIIFVAHSNIRKDGFFRVCRWVVESMSELILWKLQFSIQLYVKTPINGIVDMHFAGFQSETYRTNVRMHFQSSGFSYISTGWMMRLFHDSHNRNNWRLRTVCKMKMLYFRCSKPITNPYLSRLICFAGFFSHHSCLLKLSTHARLHWKWRKVINTHRLQEAVNDSDAKQELMQTHSHTCRHATIAATAYESKQWKICRDCSILTNYKSHTRDTVLCVEVELTANQSKYK